LASALLGAAFGLMKSLSRQVLAWIAFLLFIVAAVGVVLGGLFPGIIRAPSAAHWHGRGGLLAFPSMTVGPFLFSLCFCFDREWRQISVPALIFASAVLLVHFLRLSGTVTDFAGLMQRLFFAGLIPWLLLVGLQLIRRDRRSPQ
jgi:hypothetical protein